MHDKKWAYNNYLNSRALAQADNVRAQLQRTMERFEIDIVSTQDERALYLNVRKALVCGFFMQIAHKEGEKNAYLTVKDNQVCLVVSTSTLLEQTVYSSRFHYSQGGVVASFLWVGHNARVGIVQ